MRLDHLLSKEHTARPFADMGMCRSSYVDHWSVGALEHFSDPASFVRPIRLRGGSVGTPVNHRCCRRQGDGHGTTGDSRARRRRHCSVVRELHSQSLEALGRPTLQIPLRTPARVPPHLSLENCRASTSIFETRRRYNATNLSESQQVQEETPKL